MSGQRASIVRTLMVNGLPLLQELDEFDPPQVKKEMQDARGGSFGVREIMVGLEKMTASFKIKGATKEMLTSYGMTAGDLVQITVKESVQDEGGEKFALVYDMSGELTSVKDPTVKGGDLGTHEIEMSTPVYKKTENGKIIYDINLNGAGKADLGNGDILAEHRSNVGLA